MDFSLAPTNSMDPYLVFNSVSPNNDGATTKVAVRQAISYGISRSHLIVGLSGAELNPPLTHILPDGINGAQHLPRGYNPYPYNPAKARSMLAAAGFPSGLTVKLMYSAQDPASVKLYQILAEDLPKAGITVKGAPEPRAVSSPSSSWTQSRPSTVHGTWRWPNGDQTGTATRRSPSSSHCSAARPPSRLHAATNLGALRQPGSDFPDQQCRRSGQRRHGRAHVGPDRPGGNERRAHLPHHPADATALPRQLHPQRDIRTSHQQFRPDQRLAQHSHGLTILVRPLFRSQLYHHDVQSTFSKARFRYRTDRREQRLEPHDVLR